MELVAVGHSVVVGVGIVRIGAGPGGVIVLGFFEVGGAVLERLSGLVGHAVDGVEVTQADFFGGGEGVLFGAPHHRQSVLRRAPERLAQSIQLVRRRSFLSVSQKRGTMSAS